MPYDETLAERVRPLLCRRRGFAAKKMFGGIGFLLNGSICVGVWKEFLIVRVGPSGYEDALTEPYVRQFDITGRAMKGWVMVEPGGVTEGEPLQGWVQRAVRFVCSLPAQ